MKLVLSILILMVVASTQAVIRFVCYFPNWAYYRPGAGAYTVSNIDPTKCSHLIYAFAVLDVTTYNIKVYDPWVDTDPKNVNGQMYSKFVALKKQNPSLKTMIAIGGWKDSTDGTAKYSKLVSNTTSINIFVSSVVSFLKLYGFDGLDVDWEYPVSAADKAGFVQLLSALRTAFGSTYLLSIAAGASSATVNSGYNVPSINSYVDFINLMEYDMHGSSWESTKADHHAPYYKRSWDTDPTLSVNGSVSYWINQGASPSKLNMGIPLYGQSWTLTSSTVAPPAPANGAGTAGPYTGQPGFLAYYEICNNIKSNGWIQVNDPSFGLNGPYAYSLATKQWVGFDDETMVTYKTSYALGRSLGGVMVWDISTDDFLNTCGGLQKNPLISAISFAVNAAGGITSSTTTPKATSTAATTTTTPKATTTVATTTTTPKATTTVAKTTTTPKATTTATGTTGKATTTAATTTSTTKTTTKAPGFVCPQAFGLYPNPASCSSFYQCSNGVAYLLNCPTGLYFNPKTTACDYPANVVCNIG